MSQPYPVVMLMTLRLYLAKATTMVLLALLVISMFPFPSGAMEVSDEIDIESSELFEDNLRVDSDGDGNYHMVTVYDFDSSDYDDLVYRKVDPAGEILEGPLQISPSNAEQPPIRTSIAVDSSGRAHIAFVMRMTSTDPTSLYYAQVGSDGKVAVAAKKMYTDTSDETNLYNIDIDVDSSGNSYVVWRQSTDPWMIMWMKISPSGTVAKSAKEISGELGFRGTLDFPSIGVTSSGVSMVVWQQKSNQAARTSIWYTQLDGQGVVDVDPREVASSTLYDLSYLEATSHPSSAELHFVFVENDGIQYRMVDRDGDLVESREIYSDLVAEATGPDIAVAGNDDIFICYFVRDNPLVDDLHIHTSAYWGDSGEWDGPFRITEDPNPPPLGARPAAHPDRGAIFITGRNEFMMFIITEDAGNQPPVPSLSFYPTDPAIDELVTFDGRDSTDPDDGDTVEDYFFDFGDGSTSGWMTSQTVTHTYSSASTYTATLRVRDDRGLESTGTDSVTVTVTSSTANKAPTAVLSADETTPDKGQQVTFSGTASFDTDGVVSEYLFTFGDGVNSGWVSTATVKHAYSKEGVFTVNLKVRDDDGAESPLDNVQISVIDTNEAPTAEIVSITPNPALQGVDVTFTGQGTDTDGTIETYSWESSFDGLIGDGTNSFITSALVVGTHTITFKVRDDDGVWSEPVTRELEIKANMVFTIEDLTDIPDEVFTDKLIEFRVKYSDPDNDPPTVSTLLYSKGNDWKTEPLREVNQADTNYVDGKEYYFNKKFDAGDWKYKFEFRNSQHPEKTTPEEKFKVEEPSGRLPGPGVGAALGAIMMASIVVAVTSRGRKGQD